MVSNYALLIEGVLVLGVALGWGFWELYSLRKYKKADAAKRAEREKRDGA